MSSENAQQRSSQQTQRPDVLLYVEQEAPSKFKIQSDQLEQIGAKLRGPRRFSIFNSLVLPALVTLLTTILTGTFQYLSWINTVRLQAATAVADRAAATFDKAATLIGQRVYGTLVFVPTIRDLAQSKALNKTQDAAAANDTSDRAPENQINVGAFVPAPAASAVIAVPKTLTSVNYELESRRYEAYYERLKLWNEGYDQLIAEIDYNLDRPILVDAEIPRMAITVFAKKLNNIKC